jgi:hypothetical protein
MRAAAANPDAATFLGSGEADLIPQGLQKQPVGFQLQVIFFTVDEQSDLLFHESGAYLLLPIDSTYPRKKSVLRCAQRTKGLKIPLREIKPQPSISLASGL